MFVRCIFNPICLLKALIFENRKTILLECVSPNKFNQKRATKYVIPFLQYTVLLMICLLRGRTPRTYPHRRCRCRCSLVLNFSGNLKNHRISGSLPLNVIFDLNRLTKSLLQGDRFVFSRRKIAGRIYIQSSQIICYKTLTIKAALKCNK